MSDELKKSGFFIGCKVGGKDALILLQMILYQLNIRLREHLLTLGKLDELFSNFFRDLL